MEISFNGGTKFVVSKWVLSYEGLIWGIMLCGEESVLLIYDISIASKNGLFETV